MTIHLKSSPFESSAIDPFTIEYGQSLEEFYGAQQAQQTERYQRALANFIRLYGAQSNVSIFRAPGRVNLIGEHTDYNHGFVLPIALDKDILLLARPRSDAQILLHNSEDDFSPSYFSTSLPVTLAERGDWSNYIRAAAHVIGERLGHPVAGFDGLVVGAAPTGVPRGAGLSSSSALTVAAVIAFATFAGVDLPAPQLVQLCSDAEWYVGTRGGIMDHFTSLCAQRGHALFLDCRPRGDNQYFVDYTPLPADYRLLVVDSGVKHQNTRGDFNQRVAACRAGVAFLRSSFAGITHLRDVQNVGWDELEPLLPEVITLSQLHEQGLEIGDIPGLPTQAPLRVRACCRHVWSENRRVLQAFDAMKAGAIQDLGELLTQAHASVRDDYTVSCRELEILVAAASEVDGVIGARLTGAGWGGCIVAVVHEEAVGEFNQHVGPVYQRLTGRQPSIFPCTAGAGAGMVVDWGR